MRFDGGFAESFSIGGFLKGVARAGVGFIVAGPAGAAASVARDIAGGGNVTTGVVPGSVPAGAPPVGAPIVGTLPPPFAIPRFGNGSPSTDVACSPGTFRDVDGACRAPGSPADIDIGGPMFDSGGCRKPLARPIGGAVMGRYGTALEPGVRQTATLVCLPGMVLGTDRLCYERLTNKERLHPKGRAPLLTGGERNAISRAARAARKIESTTKSLERLGMLKKPTSRRRATKGGAHAH